MTAVMKTLGPRSVGVGWRSELAADLLAHSEAVDFVEVVAESCFVDDKRLREVEALTALWPVVPHGVKLSLAGADAIEPDRVRRLASLVRRLRAPLVSEHVAFVRANGLEIGHLTAPPRTRAAVRAVARNVATLRRALPSHVPLLLENAATTVRWHEDEMSPGAFAAAIAMATGCGLLLDISNLCADAWNAGLDPADLLADYPWDRVGMVHVAGGRWTEAPSRFYLDSHADPVTPDIFGVVRAFLAEAGPRPLLLERDGAFPRFVALLEELGVLRALVGDAPHCATTASSAHDVAELGTSSPAEVSELATLQARLVSALLAEPAAAAHVASFAAEEIAFARGILLRKRVEEALGLLPNLSRQLTEAKCLALGMSGWRQGRRGGRFGAAVDAIRLAEIVIRSEEPTDSLKEAARRDLVVLTTSFSWRAGRAKPRWFPARRRFRDEQGRPMWAIKGLGRHAPVRIGSKPW